MNAVTAVTSLICFLCARATRDSSLLTFSNVKVNTLTIPVRPCIYLFNNIIVKTLFFLSDVDECVLGTHECADVCVNTIGAYTCRCSDPGLTLGTDGFQCVGKTSSHL